ncbi:hypothetical protein, partial [Embleya sp. NPDC005575]|uniref:hypothetical protein n=1 Tax=Embleya sp. NPDC005575 TaxID=3156892 RepID=UPI0033B70E68
MTVPGGSVTQVGSATLVGRLKPEKSSAALSSNSTRTVSSRASCPAELGSVPNHALQLIGRHVDQALVGRVRHRS